MFVYTPYGYADNTKTKYPVLYLLHGAAAMRTLGSMGGPARYSTTS